VSPGLFDRMHLTAVRRDHQAGCGDALQYCTDLGAD
jgi:hypothetical protein